jgi:hypothetical protein
VGQIHKCKIRKFLTGASIKFLSIFRVKIPLGE